VNRVDIRQDGVAEAQVFGFDFLLERPAPLEATGMALIGTALAMLAWSPRSNAPSVGA